MKRFYTSFSLYKVKCFHMYMIWTDQYKCTHWFPGLDLVLRCMSITFRGGSGTLLVLMWATAAQAAVALWAAAVNGLNQEPVDQFIQLRYIRGHGSHLSSLRSSEHILIQRTPTGQQWTLLYHLTLDLSLIILFLILRWMAM